jgi:hypothetical protein
MAAIVKCFWMTGKGAFAEGTGIEGVLSRLPEGLRRITKFGYAYKLCREPFLAQGLSMKKIR